MNNARNSKDHSAAWRPQIFAWLVCSIAALSSFAVFAFPDLAHAKAKTVSRLDFFEQNETMDTALKNIAGCSVVVYQPIQSGGHEMDNFIGQGVIVDKGCGIIVTGAKNLSMSKSVIVRVPRRKKPSELVSANVSVIDEELGIAILSVDAHKLEGANEAIIASQSAVETHQRLYYMGIDYDTGRTPDAAVVVRSAKLPLMTFDLHQSQGAGVPTGMVDHEIIQVHNGRNFFMAGVGIWGTTAGEGFFDDKGELVAIKHSEWSDAIFALIPMQQIMPLIEHAATNVNRRDIDG